MKCENCGSDEAAVQHLSRSYGKGEKLLLIQNVPVVSCPACGASYLTAQTMREVGRIKKDAKTLAKPRQIPVAQYAT